LKIRPRSFETDELGLAAGDDVQLIVLDPVYKLLGGRDENSAGDISELLNEIEKLAVETGAAVAFGAHYSKGNQAGKESIDRISGSGVFARDPDSILTLTKHEQEDAFTVDSTLRNHPPIAPFVVSWNFPLMRRDNNLDPAKLKTARGRAKEHDANDLLEVLGSETMTTTAWKRAAEKHFIKERTFYRLAKELKRSGQVRECSGSKWART
jgi:AAA domain